MAANSATCWPDWTGPASNCWKIPNWNSTRSWDAEDLLDLDLVPAGGEKINDPVRTYLREMGTVPLLSREGETEIARRIERGQNTVMKALSRSPLVIQEILDLAEEMRRGVIPPRDVVLIGDPLIMDDAAEESGQEFIAMAEDAAPAFQEISTAAAEAERHSARHEAQTVCPLALGNPPRARTGFAAGAHGPFPECHPAPLYRANPRRGGRADARGARNGAHPTPHRDLAGAGGGHQGIAPGAARLSTAAATDRGTLWRHGRRVAAHHHHHHRGRSGGRVRQA